MAISRKNIRDSIQVNCGTDWILKNRIEESIINDQIDDELELLAGNIGGLETDYTLTATADQLYIDLPDDVMMVRNVWYDYTSGSDWGTQLTEITPSDVTGNVANLPDIYTDIESGTPDSYFLVGRNVVGGKKLYFDKKPSAVTIRIIYWKWPSGVTSDTGDLEISRLWGKVLKHKISMNLLSTDGNKALSYRHQSELYNEALRVANETSERSYLNQKTRFSDI